MSLKLLLAPSPRCACVSESSFGSKSSFPRISNLFSTHLRSCFPQISRNNRGNKRKKNKRNGFSLIELLIVCAIIATIAAIAIPSLIASIDQAHIAKAVGDIHSIQSDVTIYWAINGDYPDTLVQIGDDTLTDPWGNPYQYLNHTNMKGNGQARKDRFLVPLNDDYGLYSMGKDGKSVGPLTA